MTRVNLADHHRVQKVIAAASSAIRLGTLPVSAGLVVDDLDLGLAPLNVVVDAIQGLTRLERDAVTSEMIAVAEAGAHQIITEGEGALEVEEIVRKDVMIGIGTDAVQTVMKGGMTGGWMSSGAMAVAMRISVTTIDAPLVDLDPLRAGISLLFLQKLKAVKLQISATTGPLLVIQVSIYLC